MKKVLRFCLFGWAALSSFVVNGVQISDSVVTNVSAGVWTTNFTAALRQSRIESRPIIMFAGSRECLYCRRLETVLKGKGFLSWVKDTGIYLAEAHGEETNSCPAQAALVDFVMSSPLKREGAPYVGVYWPRSSNDEVRLAFTGRRRSMPGDRHSALTLEFVSAIEKVLSQYLKDQPPRPTFEELAARTVKHISVASEGSGTVSMDPETGDLKDAFSSRVNLTAKAAAGFVFAEWRAPDGRRVRRNAGKPKLKVTYDMPEGTYTAVFKRK